MNHSTEQTAPPTSATPRIPTESQAQDEFYWDVTTATQPEPPIQISAHSSNIPPEFIANTLEKISSDPYLKYLSVTVIDLRDKVKNRVTEKVLKNSKITLVNDENNVYDHISRFAQQTVNDSENNYRRLLVVENINTLSTKNDTRPDTIDILIHLLKNKQEQGYRVLLAKSFEEIIDANVSKLYEYLSSADLIKYSTYVDDQNGAYRINKVYRKF